MAANEAICGRCGCPRYNHGNAQNPDGAWCRRCQDNGEKGYEHAFEPASEEK